MLSNNQSYHPFSKKIAINETKNILIKFEETPIVTASPKLLFSFLLRKMNWLSNEKSHDVLKAWSKENIETVNKFKKFIQEEIEKIPSQSLSFLLLRCEKRLSPNNENYVYSQWFNGTNSVQDFVLKKNSLTLKYANVDQLCDQLSFRLVLLINKFKNNEYLNKFSNTGKKYNEVEINETNYPRIDSDKTIIEELETMLSFFNSTISLLIELNTTPKKVLTKSKIPNAPRKVNPKKKMENIQPIDFNQSVQDEPYLKQSDQDEPDLKQSTIITNSN